MTSSCSWPGNCTAQWFAELSLAAVLQFAQERGVTAAAKDGEAEVVSDLGDLVGFAMEPLRIGWLRSRAKRARRDGSPLRAVSRCEAVEVFERHASRAQRLANHVVSSLESWLREAL